MKKIIAIFILLLIFASIGLVNAEDVNLDDNLTNLDNNTLNDTLFENTSHNHTPISDVIFKSTTLSANGGSLSDFQNIINSAASGDIIELYGDYTYNGATDSNTGLYVNNKELTINGNGHTFNGLDSSVFMTISSSNKFILNNTNIIRFTTVSSNNNYGDVMWYSNSYLYMYNCTFRDMAFNWYLLWAYDTAYAYIYDCHFENLESYQRPGIIASGGNVLEVYNSTFNNIKGESKNGNVGGIFALGSPTLVCEGNLFTNVYSIGRGGIFGIGSSNYKINNNIFVNVTGTLGNTVFYNYNNNFGGSFNNNWFGTNLPNWNEITGGSFTPETWVVMNFTNTAPFSTSGGNINLLTSLDYAYNRTSNSYQLLTEPVANRNVTYSVSTGSISSSVADFSGEDTQTYSYPAGLTSLTLTATIDNQTLNISNPFTTGSFTELQRLIDATPNGGVLNLVKDYIFDPARDIPYKYGMFINKTITIIGNGHTLDGINQSRIFNITGANVKLDNITIYRGNATNVISLDNSYHGGGVLCTGDNLTLVNCTFDTCYSNQASAALDVYSVTCYVRDCKFFNSYCQYYPIDIHYGATGYVTGCLFENNTATGNYILYIYYGAFNYNVFFNNTSPQYTVWKSGSVDANYNWWGTNSPNLGSLINGGNPNTWAVMDFNYIQPLVNGGGTTTFLTTLNTYYNSSSQTYGNLAGTLPTRKVFYNVSSGTVTPTNDTIQGNHTASYNYPSNINGLTMIATIDNQNITLGIGSFTALQGLIDKTPVGGELNLTWNVTYNPLTDGWLQYGMRLNKTIRINGNGFTLNGDNQATIFRITGVNITLDNITYINGKAMPNNIRGGGTEGAAISSCGDNLTITNSLFMNGTSTDRAAAILISGSNDGNPYTRTYIENCTVINNTCPAHVVNLCGDEAYVYNCVIVDNNVGRDALWITYGNVTNCVFSNGNVNYEIYNYNSNGNVEYNWYGTNNPNLNNLIRPYVPDTYVVMNFTGIGYLNPSGGSIILNTSLNTIYNKSSGNFSPLVGDMPIREVTYTSNVGSFNVSKSNMTNQEYVTFYYPSVTSGQVNATIDKQTLSLPIINLDTNINVSTLYPSISGKIRFIINVTNNGPYDIYYTNGYAYGSNNGLVYEGLVLNFTLPYPLNFTNHGGDGIYDNVTGIWAVGNLSSGQTKTLIINASISYDESLIGTLVDCNLTYISGHLLTKDNNPLDSVTLEIVNKTKGSYTEFQEFIDNTPTNGVLVVPFDVTYDPATDGWLKGGMRLNRSMTVIGGNHTFSGDHQARIFYVTAHNVYLDNFTFIDGVAQSGPFNNRGTEGAAIASCGDNLTVNHSRFMNGYSTDRAAAILSVGTWDGYQYTRTYLDNCYFINNTNPSHIINLCGNEGHVTNCIIINNTIGNTDGYPLWLFSGNVSNNVIMNRNYKEIYFYYSNGYANNNWWGTNNVNLDNMVYGGNKETYVVMNFTAMDYLLNSAGGNVILKTTLNTIYNKTSGNYSALVGTIPLRNVTYTLNTGNFNVTSSNLTSEDYVKYTYPSGANNIELTATIDNQNLTLKLTDLDCIFANVTTESPAIGNRITFILNVTNTGNNNVTYNPGLDAVVINFTLPYPFYYISSAGEGVYDNNSGVWFVGNLTTGQTKSINITGRIPFNYAFVGMNTSANLSLAWGHFLSYTKVYDEINLTIVNKTSGSYTDLQAFIDDTPENGTLIIPFNVTYDPVGDAWLQNGMRVNKTITLIGNGHTISGQSQARIFLVTANNVILTDIIYTNGTALWRPFNNRGTEGAAIASCGDNLTITNSTFKNGYTTDRASAILIVGTGDGYQYTRTYINNCYFTNNTGPAHMINLCGNEAFVTNNTMINNTLTGSGNTVWFTTGRAENNVIYNNVANGYAEVYFNNGGKANNNWWGNNTPTLNTRVAGGTLETYVVMNFTNTTPITSSSGTSTLLVSLDTVYNISSGNYEPLVGGLPYRNVTFNWTNGIVSPSIELVNGNATSTFTYPSNMSSFLINATIDNQMLFIGSLDLEVLIIPSSNPANDGENISFIVMVINHGYINATNVNVTLTIPPGLINVTGTTNNGTFNNTTLIWELGDINASSNKTLILNGTLNNPGLYLLVNASLNNNTVYDGNLTNNNYTCNVTIIQWSDLEITKNVSDLHPDTKDNVTYIITVYNHGPSTARNVTVFDNLSSKLIYQFSNATSGYYNETTGIWFMDNITPEGNETLNITVFINQSGFTHNFVNVTSLSNDTNWTNNYANITFETAPLSDLWVTINMETQSSNYITYHIQAGNNGIEPANGTVVVFNLSNLYVWFNHTTDKGIYNNDTGVWDIGYLEVGEIVNMTLIVRLDFPMGTTFANVTTSVNITSWSTDLYPENNTDNITFEAEIFGNFRLLQDIVDGWAENTTQILPRSFAYDPVMDAKLPGETYDLINGVRLYKNITIINPYGFTLGGFDMARIFNISADNVVLDGLRFFDGNSPLGAALNIHADNVQVLRSNFSGNWLFGDYGGAIYTSGKNTLIMDNIFTENSASKLGGAIGAVGATNLKILNNTFINNSVESDEIFGGAIGIINSTATVNGNVFLDNVATSSSGLGSAIYTDNSNVDLEANWFGNNTPDMVTDELIWGNKPETYIVLDWEIINPNMTGVTLNAVFFLYNTTTGNKTPLGYGIPYRTLTVTARDPTISWYNTTYTGNNTFNYTYNPSIPVYQVNATVDYQTITLEWSTFLSANKTLLNDTVWFGDDLIYNITLVNYGSHDSYIVTISDLLPNDLTVNDVSVLYGSTSIIGDDVYWTLVINAGDTLTLILNTTPTKEGTYINNLTVNGTSQYDYFLWGNMSVTGEVLPLFDLSINFTISNPPYYVSEEINYTITIHNAGPSNASNVSVYIPIPSGLTFLYAWNLEGYIPNYTTTTGLWNVDTLHVNETIQINMTLRLDSANWYNQTVNITGYGVEINETDNNQTISFNVTTQVDLELNMTISTNETLYGNLISVTYSLLNKGPSPAVNTSVFTVFSGLTYSSSTGYGSFNNITPFTGYWYVGTLNKNTTVSLTLYFYANALGDFTVTGRANCSDNESYWPDNYDNVTLKVIKYADLSITKTVSNSTPYVGQVINYTITVKNNAGFNTENVTVYDNLSSYLIYDNSNPAFNGTEWFVGNLSVGESKNITFNVTVNESGTIWNNVTVNSSLNDSNYGNNHAEVRIDAIYKYADLSITKTVSNSTPFLEQTITYTITVTNLAGFDTENVTVYDLLPGVLIYDNLTPGFNGTEWFVGNLSVGESKNITFNVTVDGIGIIWNNATVNSSLRDPDTGNNHAEVSISVPVADDLRMYINTIPSNPSSNGVFIINLSVWNRGFTDNQNVTVEFHIPSSLTYVNSTNMGAYSPITGFWNIGFLGNGQWVDLQIWVYPGAVGNITLEANVSGQVADVAPWNNRANITFEIVPSFDLTITKSANATNVDDGDLIGFDITVWNNGPYLANNVQIIDYLPNGVLYYSNNASGVYDNSIRTVNWTIPVLNVGDNFTFHLTCRVWNPGLSFTNTVTASAYGTDSNLTDNTATVAVNVTPNNDLEVRINASKTKDIDLGESIVFYITVLNHGPSNATNVVAHFNIPSIFSYISDNSGGDYILSSGEWLIGNLGSGENVTLDVIVNLTSMGVCTANATVNSTYTDKNLSNNYDEINLTVTPFFDLNITAYWNLTNNTLVWQEYGNLTIIVSNDGPENATNVTVEINVPGVSYVNDTSLGNLNTTTWVLNVGNLSIGEYKNITITFRGEDCGFYWTTGNITGHGHDTNTSNNNYTLNLSIIPVVDLVMTNLTVNTTYAGIDDILEFNVTVYNKGPCNATNVTIVGFLPLNWTIYSGNLIADIPVNTSHTFNILVNASTYGNFTVGFNATINGIDTYPLDNNKTIGSIEIIYHANLMITIKVNNQYPVTGDMIVYVITVSNLDWRTAHNVTANITVPDNLTLDYYYLASGVYNPVNGTWTIGNMSFRNSTSMFLFCRVNAPGSTDFWVNVTGADYDFYPENNNDTINITTTWGLDLNITITTVNNTPYTGDNVTFTVVVENIGLLNATGVNVEVNIPVGFINPTSVDLNFTGNSWYVGDLNIGDSKSFNFTVIPVVTSNLTVNVSVGASRYDYNMGNNFANITVSPIGASDLEVNITCNNTTPRIGENVTYTILIQNNGFINVGNVMVYNNLPFSLTYSTSTPLYNPTIGMWMISNLPAGATETLNITINHTNTGIFNYTVNITGNTLDTNLTNNMDNITVLVADDNDLKVEFTVSNGSIIDEGILNFTITVINDGLYNNTNVIVYTDLLSTGIYNSSEIFDTISGIWNVGNLAAGENKRITLAINLTSVGNYTYWANATGDQNDRNYTNNNQSINITIYADYDLQVNITQINNTLININDTTTLIITVTNYGPSTAHNIQVLNDINGTLTGISKGTYTSNIWNISNLTSGETQTLNLTIKPNNNGTYTYNVEVIADNFQYDRNNTNNKDNITINVTNIVDLIINITSNKTMVNKTETAEFTITVTNKGNITANNILIETENLFNNIININPSTGFVSSNSWLILSLAPNTNETLKITKIITNDTLVKVNVSSNNQEKDNTSNFANTTVYTVKETDLKINITANTTNIHIGENITFTITVTNLGNETAENVTVHLDLPYTVSYDNVYMYDSQQGIWLIGELENNTSINFNVTATINTPGIITYNATVNTTTLDFNLLNNYDNVTINITSILDLEINIALNTTEDLYSTDSFIVFVNVTNHGPSNATGVTVNLNIPGTMYNTNNGTYNNGVWNIGNIPTGETVNLNITCNLTSSNNGIYYANVTSIENDKNTSNNNVSLNLTIIDVSDLEVTVTSSVVETDLHNALIYTVSVINYGSDTVNDAIVNIKLPDTFNITSNMSSNGIFNGTHWILSSLGTGFSGIANLYITGNYNAYGNQTVFVQVNSSNRDDNKTNNQNNVSVWITPVTDLVVNFTTNGYYNPDGTITFNITVTNNGPCNATDLKLYTDLNPTNTYNESSGYFDTLQNIWYISQLNTGESTTLIINTTYISGTEHYANITSSTKELNNSNNIKYLNFTITPLADLSINITVNESNPLFNELVMFTITATNLGPYNATDVIVNTDLSASPIYIVSKGLFSTVTGNWSIGNLSMGETVTLKIIINATSDLSAYTNITGNVNDSNISNNNATINITLKPVADLSIKVTLNQSSFLIGDNITITVNITNSGPNIAENITINTTLPIGFVPDSQYSWNLTNLANNTCMEFNITGILTTDGTKTFKANIASDTYDNNTSNNCDSIIFNVENTVDLLIQITGNITDILAGEPLNILVNVTNIGNGTAQNVLVSTNIFNATGDKTGYYDKDTGYWYIGNLTSNQTVILNLTVQLIENTTYLVSVNTTNVDINTSNNNDSLNITVSPLCDLNLTVSINNDNLYLNDTLTYTITVTNKGYSIAENVNLTTNITSTGFAFISSNDTNYNNLTGLWTIGNINPSETVILKLKYQTNISGNITIGFYVNTTTLELDTINNGANITVFVNNSTAPITSLVDLIVNITVDNPTPNLNDIITFHITVYNNASTIATNVTIENFLPSGLTPVSPYTGNWTLPSLGAYSNVSFTFQANVTNYGSFVSNVTVDSNQWDANPTDNRANVLVVLNSPSGDYTDLIINVTRSGNLTLGETFTYNITVTNIGPSTANDVNVTISLFTGLDYVSDTSMGAYNFTDSLWNVGNLSVGENKTIEITLNITQNGYYNNAFLVYGVEMDKNPQNNLVLDNFQINDTRIDVSVKISANKTYVGNNETILFTVTVINHLNPANDVNVTLDIPNEFNIISFPGYTNNSYYIGSMLSGEVINFTFTAKLNSTNSSTIIVNTTLNETDSYVSDNFDSITITPLGGNVNGVADLHINITVNEQYPEIETVPIFNVWVTNFGPDDATNIEVPIYIPADCISTSADMYWDNSTSTFRLANLSVGSTVKFEVSFRISTTNPILFNASAKSDQFDPNITDNKASISLYPWEATPTCDLNITIVPIGDEFHANDTVKFNVTIRNFGEKTAFNVSVRNIIPPGLTLESISTTWAYTLTSDGWFMPNHTINTNKSFILTYKISNKGLYQTTMEVNTSTLDVDPTSNGMGVAIYAGEAEPDRRNVTTKATGTVAVATLNGNANWTFKGTLKMANTTVSPTQNFQGQKLYANITSTGGFELIVESIDVTGTNGVANFAVNSAQLMTGANNYKVTIFYKGEKTDDTYYLPSTATSITRRVTVNP